MLQTAIPSAEIVLTHIGRGNYHAAVNAAYRAIMERKDGTDPGIEPSILIDLVKNTLENGPQGSRILDGELATVAKHLLGRNLLTKTTRLLFIKTAHNRRFYATKKSLLKADVQ